MKALTLKAPWGTAIAKLGKDVENRSWKPPAALIGQRIAIHEGAGLDRDRLRWVEEDHGQVEFEHAASARRSAWYRRPVGWVLTSVPRPRARVKIKGMLGVWSLPTRAANRLLRPKAK